MPEFSPEAVHDPLLEKAPRILAFDPAAFFPEWQSAARRTFKQLLGLMPNKVPLDLRIQSQTDHPATPSTPAFTEISFLFTSEPHAQVPCTLLLPRNASSFNVHRSTFPCIICLQGHTSGAHISLGRPQFPEDAAQIGLEGQRDYALQAIAQGYAALVLEQRAFGTRADARPPALNQGMRGCHHAAMVALLLGRTLAGERVWDVSRAIDTLIEHFPQCDPARIACTGDSGGGLITYLAAAFDTRIAAAMPACAICTARHSIGTIGHCEDNYLPGILHYFDTADLAGLIAPRPLLIIAGENDPIFPIAGTRECFAEIQTIYQSQNIPDRTRLIVGTVGGGGHRFYSDLAWPAFKELTGW